MYIPGNIRKLFLVIIVTGWTIVSIAQIHAYNFEKLNTSDGLSCNRIGSILQDRDGFYWISTEDGLNRFDGTTFKVYRNDKKDSQTLVHNNCNFLLEADDGDIWVSTYNGVSVYRKKTEKFENYTLNAYGVDRSILNRITGIVKDKAGNIWITSRGLWKYDKKLNKFSFVPFLRYNEEDDSYPSTGSLFYDSVLNGLWFKSGGLIQFYDLITQRLLNKYNNGDQRKIFDIGAGSAIFLDKDEQLWYLDDISKNLCVYHIRDDNIEYTPLKKSSGLRKIEQDSYGRIWLSCWFGNSIIYDPKTKTTDNSIFNLIHPFSAAADHFIDLYIDRDSSWWIGSSQGISVLKSNEQFYEVFPIDFDENKNAKSKFSPIIRAVAEKSNNELFVGTYDGLYSYNLVSRIHRRIIKKELPDVITCLYFMKDSGKLWVGGMDEVLIFDVSSDKIIKKIPVARYSCFIVPYSGSVWIGTWANGLYRVSEKGDLQSYYGEKEAGKYLLKTGGLITACADDKELWIGMNAGNGFAKYNSFDSSFENFNLDEGERISTVTGTINALKKDHDGNLWIGSHGGGIYFWDRKNNKITQYLQSDGLRSNFIYNILVDENNNLWIAHSNGADFLVNSRKKFIPLRFDLPATSNDFHNSALESDNGDLIFYNSNTIVKVDPRIKSFEENSSNLIISSFRVFGSEVPLRNISRGIFLNYKQNFFTIEFSKLRTNPSEDLKYAYLLEGFDKEWNYSGSRNFASYTNVPGGDYTFRLKVMNESGEWGEKELSMPVTITIPYWRTWWFLSSAILFISAIVFLLVRYRIQQLKKVYRLRTKISQDLHDEIGATLSSIHVYSSVAVKALNSDQEKSKDALHQINENTRQVMENMNDIVWAINANQSGSGTLENKLKNYGYDLLSPLNIECTYQIDREAEKKLVNMEARKNVLLIAKEAINNIAKYSAASEAVIRLEIENKMLAMEISDNGKGLDRTNGHIGNGLENMKDRSKALGGILKIKSVQYQGTSVLLEVPLPNISD